MIEGMTGGLPLFPVTGFARTPNRICDANFVKAPLKPLSVLVFLIFATSTMNNLSAEDDHEGHVRKPLPPAEVIRKLPADGGEEFNRLVFEKSPYLLQHARNEVDWWPWGEAAFAEAAKTGKPIFLSIGYTTCHWCHVMEHESFEDKEVGDYLNKHFIPVKVDREERPDIDEVYMTVTQALTGRGGWPMTVVMTPEKKPFFAGTYFPRKPRAGSPGVMDVLEQLADAWENDNAKVLSVAGDLTSKLADHIKVEPGEGLKPEILDAAYLKFKERYDPEHGGFAMSPKFPVPPNLMYLMRHHKRTGDPEALEMVEKTLVEMRRGGIFDHVGFGFHRYSTDRIWLTPHFEKMLYDQALISMAYLEAYQITGKETYAQTAREIFTYVLRDMTSEEGGFYSAEDADSEGEEGTFYIWSNEEVIKVLGEDDADFFNSKFNVVKGGNFKDEATGERVGASIPHLRRDLTAEEATRYEAIRLKLWAHREKRIHPQKDDKILTDWNGLMIAALAKGAQVLGEQEYQDAAVKAADFVLAKLRTEDGKLLKRYRLGDAGLTAHLEDYAFMSWGLLELYETTFDTKYLEESIQLTDQIIANFWDAEGGGGFYMTANDSETLIVRPKKLYGGAIPSGNSVSLLNLSKLYRLTGDSRFADKTDLLIKAFSNEIERAPSVVPLVMCGLDFHFGPSFEVVIANDKADSDDTRAMIEALRKPYIPNKVVILRTEKTKDAIGKLAEYSATMAPQNGKATAYVCVKQACDLPTNDIKKMLESLAKKPEKKAQ